MSSAFVDRKSRRPRHVDARNSRSSILPVSDVDRAKRFYQGLGWRMDGDFTDGKGWRVVQMTPRGSPCSIVFGKEFTAAVPGSMQGNFLVVADVEAARADPSHAAPM